MPSKSLSKFPHVASATTYARAIVKGKVPACRWVRLACQRHLTDLKRKSWDYRFDRSLAERACEFIESFPHVKGRWAAKREMILLEPWQRFLVCSLFGWVEKSTGFRRFRECVLECPRKNGKSFLAAAIGLKMFAADQENGAEVYSGATSEKQAWEIFRPAHLMAKRSPDFCETFGILVSASNLAIPEHGSRFEPLIGDPGDGASPSCALIDEYHEHKTDRLYETMVTGMGAREQPLVLITTTAGSNLAGPCYLKRQDVCKMLDGVFENDRLFGLIYTIDDSDTWTDPAALRKANPNYGVSVGADYLLDRQRAAQQSARLQNAFKTKHLNLWVGAYTAWMDMIRWAQQPPRKSLTELQGRICCVGIDLASKIDIAAMVLVFPPIAGDPLWHIHGRYYLPETILEDLDSANVSHYATWEKLGFLTLTPGNVIDYDVIQEDLIELAKSVDVRRVAYDPWTAASLANALQKHPAFKPKVIRGKEEFKLVEFPQTVKNFSGPMKEVEGFVRSRIFAHGDCPVLTWMFSNVVAREDKNENIFPVKEAAGNKIDGAVATLMAVSRSLVEQPPKKSKYETEGLLFG